MARTLISISTIESLKVYPQLKKFCAGYETLWSGGYFVSIIERISEATVIKYI
ncbi:hypothetical protein [Catenibacterium mitsuokai]|uniref:hypothetical protein n=1 Tax=Catenibacterium mitsuokai TaxID=100886 RepID=UPI003F8A45A2